MTRVLPVVLSLLVLVSPALAHADDAGDDAGLDLRDAAPGCTDGLNVGDLAACDAKRPGDPCVLPSGVAGSCSELRCQTPTGQRILQCVAAADPTRPPGQSAPPDAGAPKDAPGTAGGGACSTSGLGSGTAMPFLAMAVALLAARLRGRRRATT